MKREVANDLDSHLEMRIAEYVAGGMEPEAAREEALRRGRGGPHVWIPSRC